MTGLRAFNIGTMQGTSVEQLVSMLLTEMGAPMPVTTSASGQRPTETEIYRLVADNSRARVELGWHPRVRLQEGLQLLLREPA